MKKISKSLEGHSVSKETKESKWENRMIKIEYPDYEDMELKEAILKLIRQLLCKLGFHKYQTDFKEFTAFCPFCLGKWKARYDVIYRKTRIGKRII